MGTKLLSGHFSVYKVRVIIIELKFFYSKHLTDICKTAVCNNKIFCVKFYGIDQNSSAEAEFI